MSAAGILLVLGDADVQRAAFRDEGRGHWAAALPLVLEKHGYLDFEVAGPEALRDPSAWSAHAAVLVARLPEGAWTERAVDAAAGGHVPVLVEGPLPPALDAALGVRSAPCAREGSVAVVDSQLYAAAERLGLSVGGRVNPPLTRDVPRDRRWDWQRLPAVPLDEAQARAWRAPGWDAVRWSLDGDAEVLATWTAPGHEPAPAIVRRGSLTGCSFGLFAFLGQCHTAEPAEALELRSWPRVGGLEAVLTGLVDELHRQASRPRGRVRPWPADARWAMAVRHDFDRPLGPATVASILAGHDAARTAATWYWRAGHLRPAEPKGRVERLRRALGSGDALAGAREAVRLVDGHARQEVALHTEALWDGAEEERTVLERTLGAAVHGTSAHGTPDGFRWQGAPNVLWAERQAMAYTELLPHAHLHPHRFAALRPDGVVEPLAVLCLPHHESLDRSSVDGDTDGARIREAAGRFAGAGGYLQVLNHPDINIAELFELLSEVPREGRWDVPAVEVAAWWRATHVTGELALRSAGGRFTVEARGDLDGLVVEVLEPDGTVNVSVVGAPTFAATLPP